MYKNKQKQQEYNKKYYEEHKDAINLKKRERRLKLKMEKEASRELEQHYTERKQ